MSSIFDLNPNKKSCSSSAVSLSMVKLVFYAIKALQNGKETLSKAQIPKQTVSNSQIRIICFNNSK